MAECQQLYELQKKATLIKGKKTPESSRVLEARVSKLEVKQTTVAMRAYFLMKSSKLSTDIIQLLMKRRTEPDRALQIHVC